MKQPSFPNYNSIGIRAPQIRKSRLVDKKHQRHTWSRDWHTKSILFSGKEARDSQQGPQPAPWNPQTRALQEHRCCPASLPRPRTPSAPQVRSCQKTRPDLSSRRADPPPALFSSRRCCCRSRRRPLAPDLIFGICVVSGPKRPESQRGPKLATPVSAPRGSQGRQEPHHSLVRRGREPGGTAPRSLWAPPRKRTRLGAQWPPGIVVTS